MMSHSTYSNGPISAYESESDFERHDRGNPTSKRAYSTNFGVGSNYEAPTDRHTPGTIRVSTPGSESGGEFHDPTTPTWHSNFYSAGGSEHTKSGNHSPKSHMERNRADASKDLEKMNDLVFPFFSHKLPALERRQQSIQSELAGIQNKTLTSLLLKIEQLQMQVSKQQQQLAFVTGHSDDSKRKSTSQKALLYSDFAEQPTNKPRVSLQAFLPKDFFQRIQGSQPMQSDINTDIWPRLVMGGLSMIYPFLVYIIKGTTVMIVLFSGILRNLSLFAPLFDEKPKDDTAVAANELEIEGSLERHSRTMGNLHREGMLRNRMVQHRDASVAKKGVDEKLGETEGVPANIAELSSEGHFAFTAQQRVGVSPTMDQREVTRSPYSPKVQSPAISVREDGAPQRLSFASSVNHRRENSLLHRLRKRDVA